MNTGDDILVGVYAYKANGAGTCSYVRGIYCRRGGGEFYAGRPLYLSDTEALLAHPDLPLAWGTLVTLWPHLEAMLRGTER